MAAQGPSGDQGKRNGNVQLELAQSEEQLSRLDKLVASLNETQTAFKHDRRGLAQLFAGLQQFMEDALGINSMYKSQPKLPASLFHDTSPSGPLHTIASVCADAMRVRGMKRIDWASPALRKENLELVSRLRQELLRAGHLRPPRVYVHPSCASETLRLTHAVTRLGGEVAPVETTPGVTHVVYPFGPKGDPDDGQTYLRALEKRGALVRVHWWYLPDSYDEWLPAAAAPEEVEPDRRPRGPWRVYSRWLADSEKHNEWMNPADYETEEAAAGGEEGGGAKRSGEETAGAAAKRARLAGRAGRPNPELAPEAEPVPLAPGVLQQTVLQPNRKAMSGAGGLDVSQGQARAGAAPAQPQPPPPPGTPSGGAPQELHRVPACAAWFRWGAVHALERAEFPDLLGAGAPPGAGEAYLAHRDAMVSRYREDPSRELSFTEARRWLAGDVGTLRRLHAFLQSWGIINAHARVRARRGREPAPGPDSVLRLAPLVGAAEGVEAALTGPVAGRVAPLAGHANGALQPAIATGAQYYCNAMPWVNCTSLRYHCTKVPDVDLCPLAYAEGRFPPGCTAKDFVRLEEDAAPPDPSGWTNEEQLLLLQAVERHGEDWAAIAEAVGTKNAMQCCTRFLQMPIEEAIVAEAVASDGRQGWVTIPEPGEEDGADPGAGALLPFADAGNPVMAQVAFLATMVGPRVAAAAAQRALEVLGEEDAALGEAEREEDGAGEWPKREDEGNECAEEPTAGKGPMKAEEGSETRDGMGLGVGESSPAPSVAGDAPISAPRLRAAAATALAAAAAKAKLLADAEERELQRLVLAAVDTQYKKIKIKLQHLEKLDELMALERGQLEHLRSSFLTSHLTTSAAASVPAPAPGAAEVAAPAPEAPAQAAA
ncbi:hypothetical protein ACKKBF_B12650 [Auxenochlorella protothecoides x Auxenochlorella symbiontica]